MATLEETIARRKRLRMASKALSSPEGAIAFRDLAALLEELTGLRDKVEEAIQTSKAAYKGDKGDPGAHVDEVALEARIMQSVLRSLRTPRDGKDADEKAIEKRLFTRVMRALPTPEKGLPGNPGANAVLDHDELAVAMLDHIKTRGILTTEHVGGIGKEMDKYWQRIKRQFPSGVLRGGGGRTTGFQAPTGTINGINQIFTFTAAPNAICVDNGRAMQKVSSDGTVNWTGATTIVIAVAPTFDIFGIS